MRYENVDDRLSRLPEEILSNILSLMDTKFAVQTSILSQSWTYRWMLVTLKTVTELRLNCSKYDKSGVGWEWPSEVYLPNRETLDIAVFAIPFESAFNLIHSCSLLERLSLEVKWCHGEKDYIFNIPTLKRLKLTWVDCAAIINKVVLRVPNLENLYVGGVLCSTFVMEDVSSLVEASVSFDSIKFDHLLVELIKGLSGVASLSIQNIPINSHPIPVFPNMKHLEFKCSTHFGVIPQFLERCPELEHFRIEKPGECCWIEPKLVPACIRTNLTTFKFSNCKGHKRDMKFLKCMLGNAEVLKTLTIVWEDLCIEEGMWFGPQVLNFPRASSCCEVHFHGSWSYSDSI